MKDTQIDVIPSVSYTARIEIKATIFLAPTDRLVQKYIIDGITTRKKQVFLVSSLAGP